MSKIFCGNRKWIRIFYNFYTLSWYGLLTYLGRVTHICVRKIIIIGSDNGLSTGWCQAIISTNHVIFLVGPLETNYSAILIEIPTFSFKKIHLNMLSGKWRPLCIGLNLLTPLLEENEHTFTVCPKKQHTVFALLCFVVVIHWLIFPYPSGLLRWHCGNLTIAPVPAKQPW